MHGLLFIITSVLIFILQVKGNSLVMIGISLIMVLKICFINASISGGYWTRLIDYFPVVVETF